MSRPKRVLLFAATVGGLMAVYLFLEGRLLPESEVEIVIFSALVMLALVTLFVEPFFTRPTDVVASTTSILLVLSPLHNQLGKLGAWFWLFWGYNLLLLVVALAALLLFDETRSRDATQNLWSRRLRDAAVYFGSGRWLFFLLFFLTLAFYVDNNDRKFLVLTAISALFLIDFGRRFWRPDSGERSGGAEEVGTIIGVQAGNIILARLHARRPLVRRFDLVEFRYGTEGERKLYRGLVVDTYLLNEEQWVKILVSQMLSEALASLPSEGVREPNVVYLLNAPERLHLLLIHIPYFFVLDWKHNVSPGRLGQDIGAICHIL